MSSSTPHTWRKRFYNLHRFAGLLALIPIISWTLSGLSHPFMSNWFRPSIAKESFKPLNMQQLQPKLDLTTVLQKSKIDRFINFRLVSFNKTTWYQVLMPDSSYRYLNADNGAVLKDGDRAYGVFLARYFLQDQTAPVKRITLQTQFDSQYQPINHLLPVWRVAFDRNDGMVVYVETAQNRLATFNNNTRKVLLGLFEEFHTWQFLRDIAGENFRLMVLLVTVVVMLTAMVTGLVVYGFLWKRFKDIAQRRSHSNKPDSRYFQRIHRKLGLAISLVMFCFLMSAAFHIAVKMSGGKPQPRPFKQSINTNELKVSNLHLPIPDSTINRIGLVKLDNQIYYQVLDSHKKTAYINAQTGELLANGDEHFATFLTQWYSGTKLKPDSVKLIKNFNNEYGFINKRLPVQRVSFGRENWYIETATGQLSTKVGSLDRAEGLSFIFLHKFFGMAWAGKDIRDIVSILSALGILVVALFGFAAYIKK
ncbi:hypothetical protein MUY27_14700 [Mucilaginibacter sp. RS28]|uniref:PepSY-associated TM region n=1 Tax=Mucilaginibacter straminoryzae TaxID=2932774 RepID=A0A9X1X5U0_9SPHI|nr:hypothetical protein [Mucilaginibacter straminoryzae]MCJ8210965.1 hypothetical protein [Mucilaginibacter straminoryzae]